MIKKERLIEKINQVVNLKNKDVLDIGCGDGNKTKKIARYSEAVLAIDPDVGLIRVAKIKNPRRNITYRVGKAETLKFSQEFDVVIFTLSLHHVRSDKIDTALKKAIKSLKQGGYLVVIEPGFSGSIFEAEIRFDAWGGDERKEKSLAYYFILNRKDIKEIEEFNSKTVFIFKSVRDFIDTLEPKKNLNELPSFLKKHDYKLTAARRINIFIKK